MSKKKTLCQWKKEQRKEKFEELKEIVSQPTHVCKNCCRAAKGEEFLCDPKPLN